MMSIRAHIRRGLGAAAALVAAAASAVPAAHAAVPADAYPTPQAIAARAEFLLQAPAPPSPATVCVIDTGVTPLPDTQSQIVERFAIDGGTPDDVYHTPSDPLSGHGSFVAATIASQVDGYGSAGIWPHAKIISVRVFPRAGAGATAADYRAAIAECISSSYGPKVIAISLSGPQATPTELAKLENRLVDAHDVRDVNVVASSGNDGNAGAVNYPARFPAALAVGASNTSGAFCSFSNRGDGLDISALGCAVHVTGFGGAVGRFSGTSFSTPTVAGILAALRAYRTDLTADAAEQLLFANAQHTSAGLIIDTAAAFRAAGLGHLVDAYVALPLPDLVPELELRTEITPFEEVVTKRPSKPRISRATFKRRVVRITVARVPRGAVAIFRIGHRSFRRPSGRLRLKIGSWKRTTVLIENRWGDRSDSVTVREPRPARASQIRPTSRS